MTTLEMAFELLKAMAPKIGEDLADQLQRHPNQFQISGLADALKSPSPLVHSALAWKMASDLVGLAVNADGGSGPAAPNNPNKQEQNR